MPEAAPMALLAVRNQRLPNPQRLRVVALRRRPLAMILSVVFPLLFFVLLAAAIGNETIDSRQGVRLAQFLAPSMASFGAIVATFSFLAVGFAEARSAGVRAEPAYAARGPGRRAWSWVAPEERPAYLLGAASVLLGMWRTREQTKPYMFGHGYHFKGVEADDLVQRADRARRPWPLPEAVERPDRRSRRPPIARRADGLPARVQRRRPRLVEGWDGDAATAANRSVRSSPNRTQRQRLVGESHRGAPGHHRTAQRDPLTGRPCRRPGRDPAHPAAAGCWSILPS